MKIKRLRLSGFKSFVEPAELRIERGLTGIVGPNGCGKSNLLEAIRWVMGENAPKSMRGSAMDDVIFAGTSTRPPREFSEVALVATRDEDDAAASMIDDEEIEVVRRIERGAGSAYRVNSVDVRAKDVALLFADAATGAHSPALVSQGRISAVIAAKPSERRQMLEEAAGIAGLHVRRKDAEQKLRATEANLEKLSAALAEMEQRSQHLRRQARAAERYSVVSSQIRTAEARMIYARWRDAAAAANTASENVDAAERDVLKATEALEAASATRAQAATALDGQRNATRKAEHALSRATSNHAALSAQAAAATRRSAELAAQLESIAADRDREQERLKDTADKLTTLAKTHEETASEIAAIEPRLPELDRNAIKSDEALRKLELELSEYRSRAAREATDREMANARVRDAQVAWEKLAHDRRQLEASLPSPDEEAVLETETGNAERHSKQAAKRLETAFSALETARLERQQAAAQRDEAARQVADLNAERSALDAERSALQASLSEGISGGVRAIDRSVAHPGYERALAAALGDDLFGAIDKETQGWTGHAAAPDQSLPPDTDSLGLHVDAPPALSARLSQVAVADRDTGQALRVGQRLVTQDGRLRRWDGFVSDGEQQVTAQRLERANRLARLNESVVELAQKLEGAERKMDEAEAVLAAATAKVRIAGEEAASAELAARDVARASDRAQADLERHREQSAMRNEHVRFLAERSNHVEQDLNAALATLAKLPGDSGAATQIEALEAQLPDKRNDTAAAQAALAEARQSLSTLRERSGAVAAEQAGLKEKSDNSTNRIAELDSRAATLRKQVAEAHAAPVELASEIEQLDQLVARLREALEIARAKEAAGEQELRGHDDKMEAVRELLITAREERARAIATAESEERRRIEMTRVCSERFECPPPLLPKAGGFDPESVGDPQSESQEHERLAAARERLGPVNLVAARELEELESEFADAGQEAGELSEAVNRLRGSIGSLNREGRQRLLDAFEAVNAHFQRLFATLFDGGSAHLELVDSDDPLEAGLEIMAQPPGKKLASLTLLSGGEQALTAIALIFALFLTNPAPICVLDEVDAPLDDANIERFCDLLDRMTRETATRYLIVTHNAVTMSRMHRLFGVTMVEQGVSRLVSVDLGGAEELLARSEMVSA